MCTYFQVIFFQVLQPFFKDDFLAHPGHPVCSRRYEYVHDKRPRLSASVFLMLLYPHSSRSINQYDARPSVKQTQRIIAEERGVWKVAYSCASNRRIIVYRMHFTTTSVEKRTSESKNVVFALSVESQRCTLMDLCKYLPKENNVKEKYGVLYSKISSC